MVWMVWCNTLNQFQQQQQQQKGNCDHRSEQKVANELFSWQTKCHEEELRDQNPERATNE
jgi:hypothetical protein